MRRARLAGFLVGAAIALGASAADERITVEDSIRFEALENPDSASRLVYLWSPDLRHVALLSFFGDLERDQVVYRLWIYSADSIRKAASDSIPPLARVERTTRRNRPAIADATWAPDGRSIYFLGEREGARQVTRLDLETGKVDVLTHSATDILAFGVGGGRVVYSAEVPRADVFPENDALVLGSQTIFDLLAVSHERAIGGGPYRTFVQRPGGEPSHLSDDPWPEAADHMLPYVSPDGRWAITTRIARALPDSWQRYANPNETFKFLRASDGSVPYWVRQFVVQDLENRTMRPVVDAPLGLVAHFLGRERAVWLEGTPYVALVNTFLPLEGVPPEEVSRREARPAIVLYEPSTGRTTRVMDIPGNSRTPSEMLEIRDVRWRKQDAVLEIALRDRKTNEESVRSFAIKGDVPVDLKTRRAGNDEIELVVEEDYRTLPRVVARGSGKAVRIGPANEQLAGKPLDRVELVDWTDRTGRRWQGGLHLPPGYDPKRRYPLVIQTYGFRSTAFRFDGAPLTGYAARALASEGMLVVQAPIDISAGAKTEGQVHQAMIEGLIDHLDGQGRIDRARVGLSGFSRSCYQVKYFLTHSGYPIRAASITEGIDFGYTQYVVTSAVHRGDSIGRLFEVPYDGPPWGPNRTAWLADAPGFNADRVMAAVRIQANSRAGVLGEWEFFVALRRLGRPVDMVAFKDGEHVLHRPRQRWIAQQGNVDWFRFWLKDEIDPDPRKAVQYARWKGLQHLR